MYIVKSGRRLAIIICIAALAGCAPKRPAADFEEGTGPIAESDLLASAPARAVPQPAAQKKRALPRKNKITQVPPTALLGAQGSLVPDVRDTLHQIQLWKAQEKYPGNHSYCIRIQHAYAGARGSFFILAYLDSDDDGLPDTEVGRSKRMSAVHKGEWSEWCFQGRGGPYYFGNCWDQQDEIIYYSINKIPEGYTGLSEVVYFSRSFTGVPNQTAGPRAINLRVEVR